MGKRKKTRRTSGSGSIYEDKTGQLFAAVVIQGRRMVRRANSRTHARQIIEDLQRNGAPFRADDKYTLGEWIDEWLKEVEKSKAATTFEDYRLSMKHAGPLRSVLLPRLNIPAINQLLDSVAGGRARQKLFVVLRICLKRAVQLKLIEENPLDSMIKPRHVSEEIIPFTASEQAKLMGFAAGFTDSEGNDVDAHRLGGVIGLGLICGLRIGECLGLHWDDWEGDDLQVQRQVQSVKGKLSLVPPKSKAGIRRVPLPDSLKDLLQTRRAFAMREGFAGKQLMFPAPRGGLFGRGNFRSRVWDPMLKDLAIPHRGFHHCRHTAATEMLTRGVPVHVVSRILGHSKPSITLDRYAQWVPQHQDVARIAMQQAYQTATR